MTYQQLVQHIHGALEANRYTCDLKTQIIELMHLEVELQTREGKSRMTAQRHPLGFFACRWSLDECRSLRIHLWSKQFDWAQEPGWEIHDHVFSFSSLVLLGELSNCIYGINETSSADRYSVFEVLYKDGESSMKNIRDDVELTMIEESVEKAVTLYSMEAGILHSSHLISEHALTVLATVDRGIVADSPRVISAHRRSSVAFNRSPTSDRQAADILRNFIQHLDHAA
ncbi:hypothetical protein [Comamonas sp. B-9]|uniref:hypothetical protein n=1 Tax=Comamonas sp. B-9 TaxID=1055192 RepID=UPI0011DCA030|nr:hypothetical protein [Comamonas sp. B-9]